MTKGGRSLTGVATPASAHLLWRLRVWRSKRAGQHLILRHRKDQRLPGLHINDRQMGLYVRSRHTDTPAIAAAKAGFSTATAYRIDADRSSRLRRRRLAAAGVNVSIYNLPLCVIPPAVRRFVAKSMSDWKNGFADGCERCDEQTSCSGLFTLVVRRRVGHSTNCEKQGGCASPSHLETKRRLILIHSVCWCRSRLRP